MIKSDRIFGLVVVIGALAYFAGALGIQTSFLSDPLGPKAFPILISAGGVLSGLVMMLSPDPEPGWPALPVLGKMGLALIVMVFFAYGIGPLGFLIATAVTASALSYLIEPKPVAALVIGPAMAVGLYAVFKFALGLGLKAWPAFLAG